MKLVSPWLTYTVLADGEKNILIALLLIGETNILGHHSGENHVGPLSTGSCVVRNPARSRIATIAIEISGQMSILLEKKK